MTMTYLAMPYMSLFVLLCLTLYSISLLPKQFLLLSEGNSVPGNGPNLNEGPGFPSGFSPNKGPKENPIAYGSALLAFGITQLLSGSYTEDTQIIYACSFGVATITWGFASIVDGWINSLKDTQKKMTH